MKLITIIGARPQFIKASPFSNHFRKYNKEILIHTGQHYDDNMSEIFFNELGIPKPDYNLNVGSGSHGLQTAIMLQKIESILLDEKPDAVLVYGDTNSTLAGALASSKLQIPIIHIEAGLRSYNKHMPEEQNRILTDHLSTLLFCPTDNGVNNLRKEGITDNVYNVGDIMFDAVITNKDRAFSMYKDNWLDILKTTNDFPNEFTYSTKFFLATIHRAENTDDPLKLRTIIDALSSLNNPVILPMHPRTKKIIEKNSIKTGNLIIIEPVGYLMMLMLLSKSYMVITDSGGLQKEAYFMKKHCVTLRNETEWIETLENDQNVLAGVNYQKIINAATRKIENDVSFQNVKFGDGNSAKKMVDIIIEYFSNKSNGEEK